MTILRVTSVSTLVLAFMLGVGCSKEPSKDVGTGQAEKAAPPTQVQGAPAQAAPAPPIETPIDLIKKAGNLPDALAMAKPDMTDTQDEQSVGTVLLTVWAANHMQWADVAVAKNETSFALVKKDSDESRGKRMCSSGQIIQISKEKLGNDKIFSGLLLTNNGNILAFLAVGSTGSLVERSRAKFCGVVTGTYDYANSGGGQGHAVAIVGMFDLPANKQLE